MTHTKLVFLRHGRTEWNELGKLQGQADVELDEVGERQAEEAARFFADWDFGACYTSNLKRALHTAHMVAEPHGLDVVPDARLQEINIGSWSGMTTAEVVRVFPGFMDFYTQGIDFQRSATGETLAEMTARALESVREVAERHKGQQVLIVTHGLLLSKVVSAFIGIDDILSIPGNITYSLVIGREKPRLATYNTPARQIP